MTRRSRETSARTVTSAPRRRTAPCSAGRRSSPDGPAGRSRTRTSAFRRVSGVVHGSASDLSRSTGAPVRSSSATTASPAVARADQPAVGEPLGQRTAQARDRDAVGPRHRDPVARREAGVVGHPAVVVDQRAAGRTRGQQRARRRRRSRSSRSWWWCHSRDSASRVAVWTSAPIAGCRVSAGPLTSTTPSSSPRARVVDRRRGAVPGVLALLEVLGGEQLHRRALGERGADGVGADVVLGPASRPRRSRGESARISTRAAPSRQRITPSASVTTMMKCDASATLLSTARSSSTTRASGELLAAPLDLGRGQPGRGRWGGTGPDRNPARATRTGRPPARRRPAAGAPLSTASCTRCSARACCDQIGSGQHRRRRQPWSRAPPIGGRRLTASIGALHAAHARTQHRATVAARAPAGVHCCRPMARRTTMTETLERTGTTARPARTRGWRDFERRPGRPGRRPRRRHVRRRRASGATWSRSPGTSPPSSTRTGCATCSARPSTGPTRPGSPARSRPTRPTAWSPPGSASRPPSAAGAGCCAWSPRTARPGVDVPDHAVRAEGARGAARRRRVRWAPSTARTRSA